MNIKMKSGEDFTIQTKGGYTLTAPDKTGTLATISDVPEATSEMTAAELNTIWDTVMT